MASGPVTIGMTAYYRITLALPLLVSAVVYLLGKSALFPAIADIVWFSMVIGGMPYLLLAAVMFFWIAGKPEKTVHQVIYLSPFFMVLLLALAVPVFLPSLRGASAAQRTLVDSVARHSIFTLVLGYLYVAAVQSVYLCLKALRRISPG
ncbi:MAG TPA: hypothetical protein VI078_16205 [bacterium]